MFPLLLDATGSIQSMIVALPVAVLISPLLLITNCGKTLNSQMLRVVRWLKVLSDLLIGIIIEKGLAVLVTPVP